MRWLGIVVLLSIAASPCRAQIREFFQPVPRPQVVDTLMLFHTALKVNDSTAKLIALDEDSVAVIVRALEARAEGTIEKKWRPVVNLPGIKITQSVRDDATVDAHVLTSVGGGISWQRLRWNTKKGEAGGWESTFSISPLTLLLSGNLTGSDVQLDVSPAATVGFFDNVLMLGGGYDLGKVNDRSRWFGLLSVGINFNQ